jgi:hypothetical protein
MHLDLVKEQCRAEIAEAVSQKRLERFSAIEEEFLAAAARAGLPKEQADEWFAGEVRSQVAALLNPVAFAKPEPADPLRLVSIILTVVLIGALGVPIWLGLNREGAGGGSFWGPVLNVVWILGILAFPLYKLLFPLIWAGLHTVRQAENTRKAVESVHQQIEENKQWVWLCQRCSATYAYNGEEDAYCGRCRNRLTKVRGMRL